MGIQNYLRKVSKATKDIKSAIEEKGVPVGECEGIESLAEKIRAIPTGDGLFTVLAFKQSVNMPALPEGGTFTEAGIKYPTGWSDGAGFTANIWMSYCIITGDGEVIKDWVTPIKISSGSTDINDLDLTDYALKSWVVEQLKNLKTELKEEITEEVTNNVTNNITEEVIKNITEETKQEIKQEILNEIDLSKYVTKAELDEKLKNISVTAGVNDINGAKGSIVFTGSGVSQSGNTFTFTGGSGSDVTKDYVDTQDEYTLKSAKDYADSLAKTSGVSSLNGLTGAVKLIPGTSNVSIGTSSSGDISISVAGSGGGSGDDGDTYRTFNIYQNTDSNETIPTITNGVVPPTWDTVNNKLLNCPSGWDTDQVSEKGKYTWMASGTFSKKSGGSMIEDWVGPICITGEKGIPGADGSNLEFIYALTKNENTKPAYPTSESELKGLFDAAEGGDNAEHYAEYGGTKWYDRAQSIDGENYRTCWMAQRVKMAGASDWTFYSPQPVIWANWGSDGQDGDGVEYIFFTTDDAHKNSDGKWYSDDENYTISYTKVGTVQGVSTNYDNTIDDWVPYGWLDEPVDIDKNIAFFEFCAVRKKKNGVWQEFGEPTLWALAVNDGSDGSSFEQVFALYRDLVEESKMSVDNASANAAGAHTTDEYLPYFVFNGTKVQSTDDPQSVTSEVPYQYVSVRRKPRGINTEWGDFSHPRLYNNYTKASIDNETLQELKDTATSAAQESIENAVSDINSAKSDINDMQKALGYQAGTYTKLNDYDEKNKTLTTQLGSVKTEQDTVKSEISTLQQSEEAITQRVSAQEKTTESISTRVATIETTAKEIREQVSNQQEWIDGGTWKTEIDTSGFLTTDEASKLFATNTDLKTVTSGLNQVTANMNQISNIYGKYLMTSDGKYVDESGYIIYATSDGSTAVYYKEGSYYSKSGNSYTSYSGSTSGLHLLGTNLFSDDETERDAARAEVSKHGVIIADNIAAISTKVSESASKVELTAAVNDVKDSAASIAVSAAKNELSNITLTADRVSFGSQTLADAVEIDSNTGKVLAGSLETKDNGNGSVKIVDDQVALCKGDNIVFKLSGSNISSGGSSSTQDLSGSRIQGTCSSSTDMSSQIREDQTLSYSWSDTVTIGSLSGVNGKLIVAPEEQFTLYYAPSLDADQYLTASGCGIINVQVRRTIGGVGAGSVYKSFSLEYTGSQWKFLDTSGNETSTTISLPPRSVTCSSDSVDVSYIMEAWVTLSFDSSVETSDLGANYDTSSQIYSVQNSENRTYQILDQDSGTAVGANGFKVALDGANRAQFTKTESSVSLILESSQYGVEVTQDNLWLKVSGTWYTPSVTSSGLSFVETSKS